MQFEIFPCYEGFHEQIATTKDSKETFWHLVPMRSLLCKAQSTAYEKAHFSLSNPKLKPVVLETVTYLLLHSASLQVEALTSSYQTANYIINCYCHISSQIRQKRF